MKNEYIYEKFKNLDKEGCIEDLGESLIEAAKSNIIEEVKYLLTSHELRFHANIHIYDDSALRNSCRYGHFEVVEYLLSSSELKEHANIHASNDYCIKTACQHGYLDILKFLIASPKTKEKIDIHTQDDYPFRSALISEQLEILQFLIFDLKIKKTSSIEYYLQGYINSTNHNNNNQKKFAEKIYNMFSIRELNSKLESELVSSNTKNKFPKI